MTLYVRVFDCPLEWDHNKNEPRPPYLEVRQNGVLTRKVSSPLMTNDTRSVNRGPNRRPR